LKGLERRVVEPEVEGDLREVALRGRKIRSIDLIRSGKVKKSIRIEVNEKFVRREAVRCAAGCMEIK
jgi:hypothetical protein